MSIPVRHPDFRISRHEMGHERAPLLVVENLVAHPDELIDAAAGKVYADPDTYYPGIRAKVPLTYQRLVLDELRGAITETFGPRANPLRFTACHFSVVTFAPDNLAYLQRIPHIDSMHDHELAFVHYLFRADLGGTAFYRHRATGFEVVNLSRFPEYKRIVDAEQAGPEAPKSGYINGDTALYEQIRNQDAVFNLLVMYRRTSLHSASLAANFVPDPRPRTGRLSINGFLA